MTPYGPQARGEATPEKTGHSEKAKPGWRETYLGEGDDVDTSNVSWGAIFAGIVTMLAVLVTFSLLGTAIGLGATDPTSDTPFDGVGTGLAIWAVITLVIAVVAGGFVAGVLAGRGGFIHGVVTWAGGMIAATAIVAITTSAALGAVGSILSTTGSAVGSGASSVASIAGGSVSDVTDQVGDALSDVDVDAMSQQTKQILAGTDVPELQPAYLQGQVGEVRDEIGQAGKKLLTDPEQYKEVLAELRSSIADRATTINDSVDRDAIAASVEANTDLDGAEAQAAVDNVASTLEQSTQAVSGQLDSIDDRIDDLQTQVGSIVADATDAAASAAAWAFGGALVALALAAFAGLLGARAVGTRARRALS